MSRPSAGVWRPFNEETERVLREDFKRLWATNFLDNLWIEVQRTHARIRMALSAKHVIVHMEERPRIKIVDYTGLEQNRAHESRREDERGERLAAPRLVPRSGRDPARRRHPAQLDGGEGLSVRRNQVERRGVAWRPEAGEGRLRRQRGPQGQGPLDRLHRQSGVQRRQAQKQDERHEDAVDVFVDHRTRHLPGSQIRGRRRKGRRPTTASRAISRRASDSPKSRRSRIRRTRKRAGSSCASRSPRGALSPRRSGVRRQQGRQERVPAAAAED